MRRVLWCVGLALALVLLPAAVADDKDKKAEPDKKGEADKDKKADADKNLPKDKKEAAEKLAVGGKISGKLIHWEGAQKYFTVQVPITYAVPDANAIKHLADLQVQLARATKPQDVINIRNQMAQVKTYQVKKEDHNYEFQAGPDMKVRVEVPLVYDDKGKPKKLTKKELDELKGPDKKLPGYTAEMSDIRQDGIVTVFVAKTKPTKPAAGKDDKGLTDTKLEAVMILIHPDATPPK